MLPRQCASSAYIRLLLCLPPSKTRSCACWKLQFLFLTCGVTLRPLPQLVEATIRHSNDIGRQAQSHRVDRGRCYKNETLWGSSFDFFQYHVAVIVRVVKPVVQENIGATCGLIAGINRPDCVMLWLCMKWQILRVYWHLKYNKNDFLAIGSPAVHVHDGVQVHLFRFLQLTAVGLTFLFTPAALINCFPVKHLCSCTMQRQLACFSLGQG